MIQLICLSKPGCFCCIAPFSGLIPLLSNLLGRSRLVFFLNWPGRQLVGMIILSGSGKHSFILIRKGWALSPKVQKLNFAWSKQVLNCSIWITIQIKIKVCNLSIPNLYSCQKLPTNNCGSDFLPEIITKPHRMASWISSLPASLKSGKASCKNRCDTVGQIVRYCSYKWGAPKKNKHLRKIHISHISTFQWCSVFFGGDPTES